MNTNRILQRAALVSAAFGAFAAADTSGALAQACMGNPAGMSQGGVAGEMAFTDGASSYGGSVNANVRGPLTLEAGYALTDFDETETDAHTFGGAIGYEIPRVGLSLCPGAGVSYTRISEIEAGVEATSTGWVMPLRVGVGKTFPAGGQLSLTPYAIPELSWVHTRFSVSGTGQDTRLTDNSRELGADMGLLVGVNRLYGGGSVALSTTDESEPIFGVKLGYIF